MWKTTILIAVLVLAGGLATEKGARAQDDLLAEVSLEVGGEAVTLVLLETAGGDTLRFYALESLLAFDGLEDHEACFKDGGRHYHHESCPLLNEFFVRNGDSPGRISVSPRADAGGGASNYDEEGGYPPVYHRPYYRPYYSYGHYGAHRYYRPYSSFGYYGHYGYRSYYGGHRSHGHRGSFRGHGGRHGGHRSFGHSGGHRGGRHGFSHRGGHRGGSRGGGAVRTRPR